MNVCSSFRYSELTLSFPSFSRTVDSESMANAAVPQLDALYTADLVTNVQCIIDEALKSGTRVAAWDSIQEILKANRLAWPAQVAPDMVGVHPLNRSRMGIGHADAHTHGGQILKCGFSWAKAADAACVEAPPAPHDRDAKESNQRLIELSSGHIPPLAQIRYLSIGGGHTNVFLRAVRAQCPTEVPELQDEAGKLNLERLQVGQQAGFKEAVQLGLRWTVLHWQCPMAWPKLLPLVIAGLNTRAQNNQSEVEVMMEMSGLRDQAIAEQQEPAWGEIERLATMSMPPCASYSSALVAYVQAQAPELIHELGLFAKAFTKTDSGPNRSLGSEYILRAATLTPSKTEKVPHIMHAALCGNLVSPPSKMIDGVCRLIMASNLSSLLSKDNMPRTMEAENLMYKARKLCDVLPDASESSRIKCLGKLDVRTIYFLCKKKGADKEYASLPEIAEARLCTYTAAEAVHRLCSALHVFQHLCLHNAPCCCRGSFVTAVCNMLCFCLQLSIDVCMFL